MICKARRKPEPVRSRPGDQPNVSLDRRSTERRTSTVPQRRPSPRVSPPAAARRFRLRRTQRSQALVELSLVTSVLLLLFLAALDLGRVSYSQVTLQNAAREGAM